MAEDGGEVDEFFGFSRMAQADDDIFGLESPEIAMGGFGRVDSVRGDSERGEGGGDFGPDVSALAEP